MKLRLLPSTFDSDGTASNRQHYSCITINERVAIDAGSLAIAANETEREILRDVVLTHAHLDHISGLPLFIDDLFPALREPVRVHATEAVIDILEGDVFNWRVYPRFSELTNTYGRVIEYFKIEERQEFHVQGLSFIPVAVNHKVPSVGFIVSDGDATFALTGDTAEMDDFWRLVNGQQRIDLLLIECAFPDEFDELASISHHLTPKKLAIEISKFAHDECPIGIVNIKPAYRKAVVEQLAALNIDRLKIIEVGRSYDV